MKKLLYYLTTLWLLLWFQVISNHFIGGTLFSVQWLLIAILHFGLRRGPWTGEWVGFIWGIFVDAASMGMLVIHAMLYALAGYAAGMLVPSGMKLHVSVSGVFAVVPQRFTW